MHFDEVDKTSRKSKFGKAAFRRESLDESCRMLCTNQDLFIHKGSWHVLVIEGAFYHIPWQSVAIIY